MNFFEHQEHARTLTRWMILLFIIAIACITYLTDKIVVYWYLILADSMTLSAPLSLHIMIAVIVIGVIASASYFRMNSMKQGGGTIALDLGGRMIPLNTTDLKESQILNIVEEMAIASGMNVPPVYLLNYNSINAFVAGYESTDAVLGITRGAIELLDRDELQAVVAHEFSHIFNGDMRLNSYLVGGLYGIEFIGLTGEKIMSSSHMFSKEFPVGLSLYILGYVGFFIAKIIKSIVCHHREFLADASAVQFTRNTEGIYNALLKLRGYPVGSQIFSVNAADYSHFFFAKGHVTAFEFQILSTHPPIKERIRKINPDWDGRYPLVKLRPSNNELIHTSVSNIQGSRSSTPDSYQAEDLLVAINNIGIADAKHIAYATGLMKSMPEILLGATKETTSSIALILGLLMTDDVLKRIPDQDRLMNGLDREVCKSFRKMMPDILGLKTKYRLPLLELAIPNLNALSPSQTNDLVKRIYELIEYDNKIELWEWTLAMIIIHSTQRSKISRYLYSDIRRFRAEFNLVLSALAHHGHNNRADSYTAYHESVKLLDWEQNMVDKKSITGANLTEAIDKLNGMAPRLKEKLLTMLVHIAEFDDVISPEEAEFIRAVALSIDCPMPPLINYSLKE